MNTRPRMIFAYLNTLLVLMIFTGPGYSQNRGNDLAFQGFGNIFDQSSKALAMGGAYTSVDGSVDALYFNPAGLASIRRLQLSVSGGMLARQWSENQVYNQNRLFFTLPFYLDGLYIPDPANNGILDSHVFYNGLPDTSYVVSLPDTGLEPFSAGAADWIRRKNAAGPTGISLAFPMKIANMNVVVSAGWNQKLDFFDYDRNDTYLNPHLGFTDYDMPQLATGLDTITMNWYRFRRSRTGKLQEFRGAVAADVSGSLNIGYSFCYFTGKTEDNQALDKVGYFELYDQNEFAFWYDTLNQSISGSSTFSGIRQNIGILLKFDAFSVGLNLKLPYSAKRGYDYQAVTVDTINTIFTQSKGTDTFKIPFSYALGLSFRPVKKFMFTLDYDINRYHQADWEIAGNDSTHRAWVDQTILRFGTQYTPFDQLNLKIWKIPIPVKKVILRAGYRTIPQVFVPDGAAYRDSGPEARVWTAGVGIDIGKFGGINLAWEYRILKYYDQYMSNANYCKEVTQNILIGYQFEF